MALASARVGWPFTVRAGIRLLEGHLVGASEDLAEALRRSPESPTALRLRALVRARQGDATGATADAQAARVIQPSIDTIVVMLFGEDLSR